MFTGHDPPVRASNSLRRRYTPIGSSASSASSPCFTDIPVSPRLLGNHRGYRVTRQAHRRRVGRAATRARLSAPLGELPLGADAGVELAQVGLVLAVDGDLATEPRRQVRGVGELDAVDAVGPGRDERLAGEDVRG